MVGAEAPSIMARCAATYSNQIVKAVSNSKTTELLPTRTPMRDN